MNKEELEKRIALLEDNIDTAIKYLMVTRIDEGVKYTLLSILENEDGWKKIG